MSLKILNQPLDRRSAIKILAGLLLLALVVAGGWQMWRRGQSRPLDTAGVRETIRDYLRDQSGGKKFQPLAAAEPTNAEPAVAGDSGTNGKKDKEGKSKKKKQPLPSDLTRLFQQQIKDAPDYATLYRVIGQTLALVDQSLAGKNPAEMETAFALAADACRAAHESAVNDWLSARIAEGYLWSGLEFADSKDSRRLSSEFLLNIAEDAFRDAGETNNLIRNYRFAIARASKPAKADQARFRLARVLEEQGDLAEALAVLRTSTDTNRSAVVKRLAAVEEQLKARTAPR